MFLALGWDWFKEDGGAGACITWVIANTIVSLGDFLTTMMAESWCWITVLGALLSRSVRDLSHPTCVLRGVAACPSLAWMDRLLSHICIKVFIEDHV